jgi:hypothetical protein
MQQPAQQSATNKIRLDFTYINACPACNQEREGRYWCRACQGEMCEHCRVEGPDHCYYHAQCVEVRDMLLDDV